MLPRLFVFTVLLSVGGCCLGTTVSSGTGESPDSTSTGGAGASSGMTSGNGTGENPTAGTGTGTVTPSNTGTGAGTGAETGTGTGTGTGTTTGTGTGGSGTTGATGTLTLSPDPIDFGYSPEDLVSIGCTKASNSSDTPITITGVGNFVTEGGAFQVSTTDDAHPPNPFSFPVTIDGGESAEICFTFTCPISSQYRGSATLLTDGANGASPVVQLTGWCGGPQIFCSPLTLAFGEVATGQTSTLSVTCSNDGAALPGLALTIGPLVVNGPFSAAFDPTVNPYPDGGLQPGQSVQIDVTYAPVDETNDFGVLAVPNNGGRGQTPYVSLSGE